MVEKFITGKITHVGSDIIDKNSQIEISLRDIDVESKLVASTIISNAKTFPISYKLKYNPSDIKPAHTYALFARINGPDNKLRYINDVQTRAKLTDTTSLTIDIAVIRTSNTSMTKLNDQKSCRPVKCPGEAKVCPYGYERKDGCEICRCHDPCNPPGKV
jgi:putative lipoprotein